MVLSVRKQELKFCQSQLGNKYSPIPWAFSSAVCLPSHQSHFQLFLSFPACWMWLVNIQSGVREKLAAKSWCLGLLMKGMREVYSRTTRGHPVCQCPLGSHPVSWAEPLWEGHPEDSSPFSCFEVPPGRKWVGWDLCITRLKDVKFLSSWKVKPYLMWGGYWGDERSRHNMRPKSKRRRGDLLVLLWISKAESWHFLGSVS